MFPEIPRFTRNDTCLKIIVGMKRRVLESFITDTELIKNSPLHSSLTPEKLSSFYVDIQVPEAIFYVKEQ